MTSQDQLLDAVRVAFAWLAEHGKHPAYCWASADGKCTCGLDELHNTLCQVVSNE